VTSLVDRLPSNIFVATEPDATSTPQSASHPTGSPLDLDHPLPGPSLSVKEMDRKHNITELINTERKFVQDLEVMHVRFILL
jgi:hypothetical protein